GAALAEPAPHPPTRSGTPSPGRSPGLSWEGVFRQPTRQRPFVRPRSHGVLRSFPMARIRSPLERRHGSAAVEFAVTALFLVPLLVGLWEVGRLVEVQQLLANAAREGGRQASTGNVNAAGVQATVVSYLTRNNIPCSTSNVTVTNLTSR